MSIMEYDNQDGIVEHHDIHDGIVEQQNSQDGIVEHQNSQDGVVMNQENVLSLCESAVASYQQLEQRLSSAQEEISSDRSALAAATKELRAMPPADRPKNVPPLIKKYQAHVDLVSSSASIATTFLKQMVPLLHQAKHAIVAARQGEADADEALVKLQHKLSQHASASDKVAILEEKCASLQSSLSTAASQAVAAREEFDEQLDALSKAKRDVERALDESRAASDKAFDEQRKIAAELLSERQKYDELVDDLRRAKDKASAASNMSTDAQRQLASVHDAAARAEAAAAEASAARDAERAARLQAEQRCDAMTVEAEKWSSRYDQAQEALERVQRDAENATQALAAAREELANMSAQAEGTVAKSVVQDREAHIAELKRECEHLTVALTAARAAVAAAEARADAAAEEVQVMVAEQERRIAMQLRHDDALAAARKEVEELQRQLSEAIHDADQTAEIEALTERLAGAREANRTLTDELEALQASKTPDVAPTQKPPSEEMVNVVQRLTREKATLIDELDKAKRLNAQLEQETNEKATQLATMTRELEQARTGRADDPFNDEDVATGQALHNCMMRLPPPIALTFRRWMRWLRGPDAHHDDIERR